MALVAHLLAVLLICDITTGSIPVPTSQDYTHNVIVDGHDNFHVFWKFDNTTITFEMHVRTTGWVGFGFSPDGGMPGSDMVMGWVTDDGEVVFSDRHATAFAEPIVDDSQDYTLLHGEEADGYTILKFERPIDTCDDQHDWLLTSDTTRVIWSHHTEDPVEGQPIPAHTHRGVKSIRLFSVGVEANPDLGEDVVTYDIRNNNYLIPATHTTYYCLGYKLPELNSKHHMIAYEPVIQAGNEAYVHHVLVYQCRISFNETAHHETGHICYTANMPDEWEYCSSTFIAWAIGGEAFYFPEHAGFSLGSVGDPTFVMVEIHYDNPDNIDNIYDSSGIRIYYTPTLRDYDASLLSIGQQVSPKQVIPPGVEEFRNYGHCLAELTQEGFIDRATGNTTDVNVFAMALHEHLLGTAVSVMHVRDGRELRMLMKDDHYDFNYQEMSKLPREVVLRPGDELLTECVYDSTGRTTVSYGGTSTTNEMCFAFLYIYPRILMDWCLTWTEWSETAAVVGIDEITPYGDPPIVLSPAEYAGQTVVQVLDSFDWDEQTIAELQRVNAEGYQGSAAFGGLAPDILEKYVFHRSIEVTDRLPTPPRACDVDDTLVLTTPDLSAGTESESMSFSTTLPLVLFLGVLLWAAIALGRI